MDLCSDSETKEDITFQDSNGDDQFKDFWNSIEIGDFFLENFQQNLSFFFFFFTILALS